ncbi:hypothetical protein [Rhizobium herbae]|uniref:Uncharacterized protein n=1 Tax=Rhizobium herbae TaxID=508661 RepID=A0ABS4EW58_9HYPH|nr:hypothetical protein [Rhizobium herbae]MBP1862201.1 hypothetical protein [Rhizobium herbae]
MIKPSVEQALAVIATCADPKRLHQIALNARKSGELAVAQAAERRLYDLLPSSEPGTLEHDVWRSIHALEGTLTQEREKTTRLNRTRQKIDKVGELETVASLILRSKPSEGFHMLVERQMGDLLFEAVALRHRGRFDDTVLAAAEQRLLDAGIPI